ncbi:hypothetical protein L2Y96_12770 [Luteibacter aegosomaticola]|uniref:hypothetical protein n=1 Tax=Luteibacter aegosomaticola TaxID=2911538 RepID=UPI001FF90AA7|nr:hypothetical protein [Luteibacter aegosomaticola]UPG88293.1 hypothetical protein L2Y96_12770 [Luteibacter aegosomaticola]
MIEDVDLLSAIQRILAVSGEMLVVGDDVESSDIVGRRYVVVDMEPPVTARLFSSMEELREEVEDTVQHSLNALGGRRYVNAIGEGELERHDFLAFAGEDGEEWLAKGENAILGQSIDKAVGTATVTQRTRL